MTRIESIISVNPNRDIIEDRRQKESFSIKDISSVLARTKMFFFYFEWFLEVDTFIHQFVFPRFSKFCYFWLLVFIYSFDPQYLLSYIIMVLFIIIFSNSKNYADRFGPNWNAFFFSEEHIHPLLQEKNQIMRQNDVSYQNLLK